MGENKSRGWGFGKRTFPKVRNVFRTERDVHGDREPMNGMMRSLFNDLTAADLTGKRNLSSHIHVCVCVIPLDIESRRTIVNKADIGKGCLRDSLCSGANMGIGGHNRGVLFAYLAE